MKIAFLGLGVMGAPMAGHLSAAGYEVVVYNRSVEKSQNWVKHYQGEMALTPEEGVKNCAIVFSCVGNDDDLRSVCLGPEGAFAGMRAGAGFVDHTTVSAKVTKRAL